MDENTNAHTPTTSNMWWYVFGVIAVVAAGVAAWMFLGANPNPGPATQNEQSTTTAQSQSTTLRDLITSATPQRCTFQTATAQTSSSGTTYIANGQMRGDFTSTANGQTLHSHMIVRGGESYIWTDEMEQGYKLSFDTLSAQGSQATQWFDPNQRTDYECTPWSVDQSMFTLPQGVTFEDLSGLVPQNTR
ncbi:MAG TPA: hypothetical protein VD928_03395 [Candidatus Paceibacterota bacterium]|nr:hypothetical protein [Candidatus Paceibacterota bacterium]